jgi:hypothetical protein
MSIQWAEVKAEYVDVKFGETVRVSGIVNANFVLRNTSLATPTIIANAFQPIDVIRDFYSISRTIRLYWNDGIIVTDTDYSITVSNLVSLTGHTLPADTVTFNTDGVVIAPSNDPPTRAPTEVEDYSIIDTTSVFLPSTVPAVSSSSVAVVSVEPDMTTAAYLDPSYNEGRIEIFFSASIAANFVSTDYFKVQRKKIQTGITRWEDVDVLVTSSSADKLVVIYLPSDDTIPLYGEPDLIYWKSGYKYRLKILADVGIITP